MTTTGRLSFDLFCHRALAKCFAYRSACRAQPTELNRKRNQKRMQIKKCNIQSANVSTPKSNPWLAVCVGQTNIYFTLQIKFMNRCHRSILCFAAHFCGVCCCCASQKKAVRSIRCNKGVLITSLTCCIHLAVPLQGKIQEAPNK